MLGRSSWSRQRYGFKAEFQSEYFLYIFHHNRHQHQLTRHQISINGPRSRVQTDPGLAEGSKRKTPDAEIVHRCSRCKMRFETDENLPKDCKYHPGKYSRIPCNTRPSWLKNHSAGRKDVDYEATYSDDDMEVWADYCEKTWGAPETMADEMDYQQGFSWSCCMRRGDAEGCKAREHDVWVKRTSV
jgi:hypothetical protein